MKAKDKTRITVAKKRFVTQTTKYTRVHYKRNEFIPKELKQNLQCTKFGNVKVNVLSMSTECRNKNFPDF